MEPLSTLKQGIGNSRAVIIVGVAENDKNGDGMPDVSTSELIKRTQKRIEDISIANNWGGIDKMKLLHLMMIRPSKKNSGTMMTLTE